MDFTEKIVSSFPLSELWDSTTELNIARGSYTNKLEIRQMVMSVPVAFVVADPGRKLKWIDLSDCYNFWKSDVSLHLAEDVNKVDIHAFPNEYAYLASEWKGDVLSRVIFWKNFIK